MEFKKGGAIMMGDFNYCLEPNTDTTSHVQETGMAVRNTLKKKMHQCQLVDAWRTQHIKARDYTFHSPVHGTYSRIDFFLIEHRLLEITANTNIEITTFSDHAPVTLQLKMGRPKKGVTVGD